MCVMKSGPSPQPSPKGEGAHRHDDFSLPVNDDAYSTYRDELVEAGLLVPLGVKGLWGRGADFERAIEHFDALVTEHGRKLEPQVMRFPPVFARSNYEKIDHI